MTTVRDIIAGAYRRLGLLGLGEDLDPARAFAGLELFNDLLASFQAEGSTEAAPAALGSGISGVQTIAETGVAMELAPPYGFNDEFPLAARHGQGVKALLAVQIAPEAGIEATATLQRAANLGWRALLAEYVRAPAAQQDAGLTWMPSQRRYGFR